MDINLNEKYKSLEPFTVKLPALTILTGLNGAGKTQILTAINEDQLQILENGINLNPKKYVTNQTLSPNDSGIITKQTLIQTTQGFFNQYSSYLGNYRMSKYNRQNSIPLQKFISNIGHRKVFERIAEETGKQLSELTIDDFHNYDLLIDRFGPDDIFHQNLSILFKRYQYNFDENRYKRYRFNEYNDKEIEFISDEEFIKKNGEAPWDLVNKIIAEAKLDYKITSPINNHRDAPFELKLINNFNQAEVKFGELSSGEKVLISLVFALYNTKFDMDFPKVLLMDEPDASLHPSMAKQFLDVILKVFVADKGVKVIMTTHSPSTVALAPEEAIFVVNKTGQRVEKVTKDTALKILTAGVPSFSVNYENRRQVFVESKYDVIFYDKIYDKLRDYLINEISLNFISSGTGGVGNCDQVVEVVTKLTGFGNRFVFGIIDWDSKHTSSDYVKVLGEGNRYSIENYIFDPILISALLFREKIITREDLGLGNNKNYSDFKSLSAEQLQFISDFLTDRVATKVAPTDITKTTVKYLNETEIDIPIWYLHHQGHDLETRLKETFPELNRFNREESLKKEVLDKVIDDIPELIPFDILELFKYIQTFS